MVSMVEKTGEGKSPRFSYRLASFLALRNLIRSFLRSCKRANPVVGLVEVEQPSGILLLSSISPGMLLLLSIASGISAMLSTTSDMSMLVVCQCWLFTTSCMVAGVLFLYISTWRLSIRFLLDLD